MYNGVLYLVSLLSLSLFFGCCCCLALSLFHPPSRRPTPLTPIIMLSWWNGNKKYTKHPKFISILPPIFFFFCSSSIGFLRCDSFLFLTKNLFFDFLMTVVICGSRELWPKMGRKKTREIGRRDTTRCFHSPLFLVLFFLFLFFLALYDAMQRMTGAAKRRILRPASHHPRKEKRRRKTLRRRPGHNQI